MRLRRAPFLLVPIALAAAVGCSRTPMFVPPSPVPTDSPAAAPVSTAAPVKGTPAWEKTFDPKAWPKNPAIRYEGREYSTIAKAVDAARNGDTIELPQGIYDEAIRLVNKKGLTLRGLGEGAYVFPQAPVGAAITVASSSGITFERILVRRAEASKDPKQTRDGSNLVTVTDSNGVSFFHCFLDGKTLRPLEPASGVVVKGGASFLFSDSFLRWASSAFLFDHFAGQVGIDRSVVAGNARGVEVKAPSYRFALHVRRSRVVNAAANLSYGSANASIEDSIVLLTKGAGDTTPATLPSGNHGGTDPRALEKIPDPLGADWSWEPAWSLFDATPQ